jgi:hypothetical protein
VCFGTFYLREAISSLWLTLERYQESFGKAFHPDSSVLHGNFTSCLLGFLREHRSTTLNGWEACNPVRRSLGIIHLLFYFPLSKHGYGRVSRRNSFTRSGHWPWLHLARQHVRVLRVQDGMGSEVTEASMENGLGRQSRVGWDMGVSWM